MMVPGDDVAAVIRARFGVAGSLTPLPGENQNVLVTTESGGRVVLKIALPDTPEEVIDLEIRAAAHVQDANIGVACPVARPATDGSRIVPVRDHDGTRFARMTEFVQGTPWNELPAHSDALLTDLGETIARLSLAFAGFEHPAARRTHQWSLADAAQHRVSVDCIDDLHRRRLVDSLFARFTAIARPAMATCPQSFLHGDLNDENVLVTGDRVTGILDFGDSHVGPTVCDLAIALAYVMLGAPEPLASGERVVAGYQRHRRLEESEIDILVPLIGARLAMSVTIAARRRREDPGRDNWFVTEEPAWVLIERLATMAPADIRDALVGDAGNRGEGAVEALIATRRERLSGAMSIAYDRPIKMTRGRGQYLIDTDDRAYLDLVNNVCHVGHCHPRVVEAGQRQMARLNTNSRYIYDGLTEYAERLCDLLPDPLRVCFLLNSGSEANELALRLARVHTGRRDVVVVDSAYHGWTGSLIAMSPYKFQARGGEGQSADWVHVAPLPDGYRGPIRGTEAAAGEAYGDEVGRVVREASEPIAAFLAESLMSCGGQIVPPDGYFATAFEHVRAAGGVCIIDEVQVGFGRVGSHFWGFELQGVVPDIVVMGKPIGNGHPLAAVVTTPEIAASFETGMEYFNTFGGNPVSCGIGMAVLDVIEDEQLQSHALELGGYFRERLVALQARHSMIGDVRGRGLFIGVELVEDRDTRTPAAAVANDVVQQMRERGVLLSTDGPDHNVLKIKPPMVLDRDDVDMAIRGLDEVLGACVG